MKTKCTHQWKITTMESEDTIGIYRVKTCKLCKEERKVYPYLLNHIFSKPAKTGRLI